MPGPEPPRRVHPAALWAPLLGWMALIFYGSSQSGEDLPGLLSFPGTDKVLHVIEYGVLGFLIARVSGRRLAGSVSVALGSAAFALAYGITDELHQVYVATRSFSLLDLAADLIGGALGGVSWIWGRTRPSLARWW